MRINRWQIGCTAADDAANQRPSSGGRELQMPVSHALQQHAIDALKLSAALASYATAIIDGKLPDCFERRDIAKLADAVFEQDVSSYGPFGDATVEADEIDEACARSDAEEMAREDRLSYRSMVGSQ